MDLVLQACQVLVLQNLIVETVQVKYVIPEEMMTIMYMFFQRNQILLEMRASDAANETLVLFIYQNDCPLIPKRGKGVDHDAADDIAK